MDYNSAANEELEQMVNAKDGEAICELGERCLYGKGGHEVNYTRAYQLFHKGEKMGLPRAYAGLGEMYRNGMRFAKNEDIARKYYQKAGIPYPGDMPDSGDMPEMPGKYEKNCGITYPDIKNKLDMAERERGSGNYTGARKLCDEVLRTVENIISGMTDYSGQDDIEDFVIEANWILAYTAFGEQNYAELEKYLSVEGVQGLHPWGIYLMTVGHRVMQSPTEVMEQDLSMLVMVCGNQNLSQSEKGDVCVMIGDLISEGYGGKSGLTADMARDYYMDAVYCGNEYAKEMINGMG